MSRTPRSTARWDWDILADRVTWSDELYRMYGLEPREFRASYQAFIERVHPEDRKRVELIVGQALRDGQPFEFEHRLVRPDGTVRVLHAHGAVERAPDGRAIRMFGTTQDVTPGQPGGTS
ncbi:MAG: PAS domain-containing protein [Gemmatimonadetes bacterium]|nr:PAS domain-containing protein [Gemmatimonadota bacterium]